MNKIETAKIVTIVAAIAAVGAVTTLTSTSLIQTASAQEECDEKGDPATGAGVFRCDFSGSGFSLKCMVVETPDQNVEHQSCHLRR
jgi:hypothetical protein